jgi:hypothetical protein
VDDRRLVITGHDHNYQRYTKNGIQYVITGGGGAPLYPVADPDDTGSVAGDLSAFVMQYAEEMGSPVGRALMHYMEKVAVERGAKHYQRDFEPSLPPDNPAISDEEIGIALCLGQNKYSLDQLRADMVQRTAGALTAAGYTPRRLDVRLRHSALGVLEVHVSGDVPGIPAAEQFQMRVKRRMIHRGQVDSQ